MSLRLTRHLSRLLAILLIAGLVFAPFSGPAKADMAMGEAAPMAMAEMAADMACCPDKSMPVDCDQCPLMALCMATNFHQPSSAGMIEIRPLTLRMLVPGSDPLGDSLGQHPPPRPPRLPVHSA
jgi:hypothetical protein